MDRIIIFFCLTFACVCQSQGPEMSHPSTTTTTRYDDIRYLAFNQGSDANLTCINKTWSETLFIIWRIKSKSRECKISVSVQDRSEDSCNDGKSLRNTSSTQSYLHIPNFSTDNVGQYKCEFAYKGGNENVLINVDIIVCPSTSVWLEHKDNKMVAVCKAEGGKPAASISWSHTGNMSQVETLVDSNRFTVESRLELSEGVDTGSLKCVISHPYWKKGQVRVLVPADTEGYPWLRFTVVGVAVLLLIGFLFFSQMKNTLRQYQT